MKGSTYRFDAFAIDSQRRVLEHATVPVALPRKSSELLLALLEDRGRLVTKEALFEKVWPDVIVEDNSLAQAVSALRRALGDDAGSPRYIETAARRGYRFIGAVEVESRGSSATVASPPAAFFEPTAEPTAVLAVLPFRSLADPAAADDGLGLGLADALIARLAGLAGLHPRPTSAVRRFAREEVDPIAAGRALAADYVLEGHLRREGGRLAVSAQLVRVANGELLWAERLGEPVGDLLEVEDRLAERIARTLALAWSAGRAPFRRGTADPEAYRLYLAGRHAATLLTAEGHRAAHRAFAAALERDPRFALAWEGMAFADLMAVDLYLPAAEAMPRARLAAERALALDPTLPQPHSALAGVAFWFDRAPEPTDRALAAALALDPEGSPTLLLAAWIRTLQGRFSEAFALFDRVPEVERTDLEFHVYRDGALYFARRFAAGLESAERARVRFPDSWLAELQIGRCREALGDREGALDHFARASALSPNLAETRADFARALGAAGRFEAAREIQGELETAGRFPYVAPFHRALVHLGLGEVDLALAQLEATLAERSWYASWLRGAPLLDPLRSDPRYAPLVVRGGL